MEIVLGIICVLLFLFVLYVILSFFDNVKNISNELRDLNNNLHNIEDDFSTFINKKNGISNEDIDIIWKKIITPLTKFYIEYHKNE